MRTPKPELEHKLEARCVKLARKEYGLLSRKLNGLGFRSWPDRAFFPACKKRRKPALPLPLLWVEFKRLGKEATDAQAELHADLALRGQRVYVLDNLDAFKKLARAYVESLPA